ncbi:MAG TPA: DUF3996 domain-containing protein [Kofleriaceae bacterium]|nr:DUF3996 domain-containing protein [Kofleriaceae bacterium]
MRTTRFLALSVLVGLVFIVSPADARPRPHGFDTGKKFEANKTFGLGLELGEPNGINGKYFLSDDNALDFGLGYIYHHYYARDNDGLNLYADYLWHPLVLTSAEAFELPLYVGVGGHYWDWGDYGCDRNGNNCAYYGTAALGLRVPVGLSFDFNNVPLDIFVQLVPTIDFFRHYRDDFGFYIDFSVGIRFWFN